MKIVTVNLKLETIEAIETLVKNSNLYPSRCELIRHAAIEFLKFKLSELEESKELREKEQINRTANQVRYMNDDGSYTTLNIKQQGEDNADNND